MAFAKHRFCLTKHGDDSCTDRIVFKVSDHFFITENSNFELVTRWGPYYNSGYGPMDFEDPDSPLVVDSFRSGSGSTYITIDYKNKLVYRVEFHDYDSFEILEEAYTINYDENENVTSVLYNDKEVIVEYDENGKIIKNFED